MKQVQFTFFFLLCISACAFAQSADSLQTSMYSKPSSFKKFNNPFYNLDRKPATKPFTLRNAQESSFSLLYDSTNRTKSYYNSGNSSVAREIIKFVGQVAISAVAENNNVRYNYP